jgi:putative peptidoglycan lipid II flippase
MVRKILRYLNKEFGGLHEAAFLLGFAALVSQLLGLLRDRLLAASFGASASLDIYYASFRLPDLLYVTIASFVSVTVLIPFIISRISSDRRQEAKDFLDAMFTVFCIVMVTVAAGLFFLVPYLVGWIAPGFDETSRDLLIQITRIMLLSPFLLGLSNLLGSVTQVTRRFFVYALSSVLYNVGIIIGIIIFYPIFGLPGLVYGVVLGALLHLGIQLPGVYRAGFLPRPTVNIPWLELQRVVMVSLPRTATLAMHQVSLLVLIAIASTMRSGSIAIFNFSYNLQAVPLAIVGMSYSVAAFPALTRMFAVGQRKEFIDQLAVTLRHIIFWAMPAMAFFIVLRAQIVRVVLGAGNFSWSDTRLTAAALALFSISVIAQSLVLLFVRAYYAAGRTSRPLMVNAIGAGIIITLAFGLRRLYMEAEFFRLFIEVLLRVDGVGGTIILMLPLAFSAGIIINLLVFWWLFQKDFGRFSEAVYLTVTQALTASILGAFAAYQLLAVFARLLNLQTFVGVFLQGLLAGVGGVVIWLIILRVMGNKELFDITRALHRKFWRRRVVAPGPEGV